VSEAERRRLEEVRDCDLTPAGLFFKAMVEERGMSFAGAVEELVALMVRDGLSEADIAFNLFDFTSRVFKQAQAGRALSSGPADPLYCSKN
jgi:hypothetical protein